MISVVIYLRGNISGSMLLFSMKKRRENYVFGTEKNQSFAFGTKKIELSYLAPS
jgi:hypothetical protein